MSAPFLGAAGAPVTVVKNKYTAILHSGKGGWGFTDKAVDGYEKRQAQERQTKDLLFDLSMSAAQEVSVAAQRPEILAELRADLVAFLGGIHTAEDVMRAWSAPMR